MRPYVSLSLACAAVAALTLVPAAATAQTAGQASAGAAVTGKYRNLFKEAGHSDKEIKRKIERAYQQLFHGAADSATVVYFVGRNENGPLAYLSDINNRDVRSEGMSYGMMIAVQMNKQKDFDALWNWSRTYMYHPDPKHPSYRYFSWSMNVDGTPRDESPAPDGEEYWAMALYFASGRWGDGHGIYNYRAMADSLLDAMLNRDTISGPWKTRPSRTDKLGPMFNTQYKMVRFVPGLLRPDHTDASYHLPHFYELWARWGPEKDRAFWKEAARVSRDFFVKNTNPVTGLAPEYANFDATPAMGWNRRPSIFGPDAWRVAGNWSTDWSWWQADPREQQLADRIQAFFESKGRYGNRYQLDGSAVVDTTHSMALVANNAIASLAATDHARAMKFVEELWNADIPYGHWRYYDGMWYLMGLLHCSGEYRVWTPKEFRP